MNKKQHPRHVRHTRSILGGIWDALSDPGVRVLIFVVFSFILGGAVVYSLAEGWGAVDSIYFATVTIATVGYGDLAPQTDTGKLFTVVYIICGIGLFVALASSVADRVIHRARLDLGMNDEDDK